MAWLLTFIPVVSAMVDAANFAPVAPKDLPAEYVRGVDGRIPYMNFRQMDHTCSYPNDSFSCANLSHVRYTKVRERSYPMWRMGPCGECLDKSQVFPPSGAGSVATFCSKDIVNGNWLMLNIPYTDESCQTARGYGKPIELPNAILRGAKPPKDCWSNHGCWPGMSCRLDDGDSPLSHVSRKCSSTAPEYCGPQENWPCSYNRDLDACSKHRGCSWQQARESINVFQFYYTLEKPTDAILV